MDTYKAKYTLFKHYIYTNSIFLYHVGMPLFTFFVPISSLSMFYMCIIHFLLNSRIGSEGHIWNFWNICKNLILTSHDFGYIWSFTFNTTNFHRYSHFKFITNIATCCIITKISTHGYIWNFNISARRPFRINSPLQSSDNDNCGRRGKRCF